MKIPKNILIVSAFVCLSSVGHAGIKRVVSSETKFKASPKVEEHTEDDETHFGKRSLTSRSRVAARKARIAKVRAERKARAAAAARSRRSSGGGGGGSNC